MTTGTNSESSNREKATTFSWDRETYFVDFVTKKSSGKHAPDLITSGRVATEPAGLHDVSASLRGFSSRLGLDRNPDKRPRIHSLLKSCLEQLDIALDYVDDTIKKANALTQFASNVEDLWNERQDYEHGLKLLVNKFGCLLVGVDFSLTTRDQLEALWSVCHDASESPSISDTIVAECMKRLEKGGWDLFREIR